MWTLFVSREYSQSEEGFEKVSLPFPLSNDNSSPFVLSFKYGRLKHILNLGAISFKSHFDLNIQFRIL